MANPVVKAEFLVEEQFGTTSAKLFEDTEVDIVSWTNKGDIGSTKNEDPDATEYSSSFADTNSDAENSSRSSDAEVESEFVGENNVAFPFDTFGSDFRMRKRKLTDHWRNFIRPLMWRLKWTELRLKQLESQKLKYNRELEEYDRGKHTAPDHFNLEEFGSKSIPFSSHRYRSKAKMRRKRKKIEATTDIASYTARHYLFSYLENKKSDADGSLDDDFDNPVITEPHANSTEKSVDHPLLKCTAADVSYELLLWNIDNLHCRVRTLKNGINAITSQNPSNFSLIPSYGPSPANSEGDGYTASVGGICNSSQHVADEFEFGDFVFPDSAVSSFGEATDIPDIIESTVGLLAAADVTSQPALVPDSGEHMVDNVLMHELQEVKKEVEAHYPIEKLQEVKRELEDGSHSVFIPMLDTNIAPTTSASQEQSALKACMNKDISFPKNKRKRGERKAGSGAWNKKSPGEPDNQ
ncbi:hypothetical protein P8452_36716 [Trifolium repens]|nr:hypothetical protein QL285_068181 [Trifolium repens]WJX50406.1 hypothetical protein P8452_36716 [Trifolium repens]